MFIDGIEIRGIADEAEAREYIKRAPKGTTLIKAKVDGHYVSLWYYDKLPFERIRRITGYLVGTTDRWNNAKAAELRDRVTHA